MEATDGTREQHEEQSAVDGSLSTVPTVGSSDPTPATTFTSKVEEHELSWIKFCMVDLLVICGARSKVGGLVSGRVSGRVREVGGALGCVFSLTRHNDTLNRL